ncbi:LamG domain-containing protein [Candidatus Woesearchaeota archaeon]|nr:LamG domain-containing protein [Candidatus Woesearchaeota archaeon]
MGSKHTLLVILVLILFSSTVYAVDFELAFGYPMYNLSYSKQFWGVADTTGPYFILENTGIWTIHPTEIEVEGLLEVDPPFIAVEARGHYTDRYACEGNRGGGGCNSHLKVLLEYNQKEVWDNVRRADNPPNWYEDPINVISDYVEYKRVSGRKECTNRDPDVNCWPDQVIQFYYAPIIVKDFNNVFVEDETKSLGTVGEIMGEDFPDGVNATVYTGIFSENKQVLFWIADYPDSSADYPAEPEKNTADKTDYILACADFDQNNKCDHLQSTVQTCWDEDGAWFGRNYHEGQLYGGGFVEGCCVDNDPQKIARLNAAGIEAFHCGYYDHRLKALCGYDEQGNHHWASLEQAGSIADLRGCPGFNIVSNGRRFYGCRAGNLGFATFDTNVSVQRTWYDWEGKWHAKAENEDLFEGALYTNANDWLRDYFDDNGKTDLCRLTESMCNAENAYESAYKCDFTDDPNTERYQVNSDEATVYWDLSTDDWPDLFCPYRISIYPLEHQTKSIYSASGTHTYLCDSTTGNLFECTGDLPSFTNPYENPGAIAETGRTTVELVGAGGCPPGILSYWTFDDTVQDSKGDFNGLLSGATYAEGIVNNALLFDGNDKVTVSGNLTTPASNFTIESWIYPEQVDEGTYSILEKPGSYKLEIVDRRLKAGVNIDGTWENFGHALVSKNDWAHIALIFNGNTARLFKNGDPVGHADKTGSITKTINPLVIGQNFIGKIDEVALYDESLSYTLFKAHKDAERNYCNLSTGFTQIEYCASDGWWTYDLDTKDESSCEKSGFKWTGHLCCSEDNDENEFYNDWDSPALPFDYSRKSANVDLLPDSDNPTFITLKPRKSRITIYGPARFEMRVYSSEKFGTTYDRCEEIEDKTRIIEIKSGESRTFRAEQGPAEGGDNCIYREIELESKPFEALGGCWNKTFVPIGHFAEPHVINYHGKFYSCGIPALDLIDTRNGSTLVKSVSPTCSHIMLHARGPLLHAVCNPGKDWQFTNNSDATMQKSVAWDIAGTNATEIGCCGPDECWNGFNCVKIGRFQEIDSVSYFCGE